MSNDRQFDADVIVVGAGPVGLTISNTLGMNGIRTILLERGDELIDYPRAIGMDDECLRTLQGIGMAERVLPHLTPNHWMRFVTKSGRCFASIEMARIATASIPCSPSRRSAASMILIRVSSVEGRNLGRADFGIRQP